MALVDFTSVGWVETDPAGAGAEVGDIRWTAYHLDHLASDDDEARYHFDFGAEHFGDFTHRIQVQGGYVDVLAHGFPWVLSNDVDDVKGLHDTSKTYLHIMLYAITGETCNIQLAEGYGGSRYTDTYDGSFDTPYYLLIKKTGTTLLCGIYSTEELRNAGDATDGDIDNLTSANFTGGALHADHKLRYLFVANTWNDDTSEEIEVDVDNLDLQEEVGVSIPVAMHHRKMLEEE